MLLRAPVDHAPSTLHKRKNVSNLYQMEDSDIDHENVIIMQCLSKMVRSVYSNAAPAVLYRKLLIAELGIDRLKVVQETLEHLDTKTRV
jgi:hypothetical protein